MSLQLGSSGPMVAAWQRTMLTRFKGYALGADGGPLKVDRYYGADDAAVQRQYQHNTGQTPDGVVSDHDLHALGLLPTLLTVHGTGQPDPMGVGYPADIARRVLDLYWWQPVGNYEAAAVPMNHSADHGEAELIRLISDPVIVPGPTAMVDFSQGSICAGRVRNRMRAGKLRGQLIAAASFGNPMRPAGSYAGNRDPGGHGIDPNLETASEPYCINLAAKGDLYTTCPDGEVGEMERAIFNMVFEKWFGRDTITEQLLEAIIHPIAAVKAAWRGIVFLLRGTGPHIRYHIDECPGTGMTYYEVAVKHLRDTAIARLERIARETS